jgi:hypothetical protein
MSWSIYVIGKPEAIKRKLAEESLRLHDESKADFDAVLPALEILLDQIVSGDIMTVVQLNASGHASFRKDGMKMFGTCSVDLKPLGILVE